MSDVEHRTFKMAFSRKAALGYLKRAYDQNRLAHAHLISGPPGSGKQMLAAELANLVNGTNPNDVFSAKGRDIFVAQPESKSRRIVIEQIRDLEHALQMRTSRGRRKVAIIVDADRLQPQAANAFLKTLEEPPRDSLLLLLSALPEALPETILSRCITIPLAPSSQPENKAEEEKLVKLLQQTARERNWGIQYAYRLAQEFQRLLRAVREEIKSETDQALRQEETRYKDSTDGIWLEEREQYYKALAESLYLERRAGLIETIFTWWSDVLRSSNGVERQSLPAAEKETGALAKRFNTGEILRRLSCLEELRDHLNRNIQEALAIEVAFLAVFTT
jgi:DNA polymerase-3 subunit delta'